MTGRALLHSAPPPFACYKAQLPIPSPDTVQKLWEDEGLLRAQLHPSFRHSFVASVLWKGRFIIWSIASIKIR